MSHSWESYQEGEEQRFIFKNQGDDDDIGESLTSNDQEEEEDEEF